jgi:GGDEF domain-containing protein
MEPDAIAVGGAVAVVTEAPPAPPAADATDSDDFLADDVELLENRLAGQTSELLRLRKTVDTSQALLDLHSACTRQRTVVGTARQIAAVASAMTGSPIVVVAVFQAVNQKPLLAVSISDGIVEEAHIGEVVCDVASQPDMAWLRTENRLRVVSRETATVSTALLLAELQAERVLLTPLFGQGEFVGCIAAKLPPSDPDHADYGVVDGAAQLQAHAGDLLHLALVLDELRRRALHDAVTGLPNLAVYEQRLVRALARRAANQPGHDEVSAILVQVLAMGRITELHGATGVQAVLREIASRLAAFVPEHDLGHLGASHFALIAHGAPGAGVDLARAAIEAIEAPMELDFGHVDVHCHAGVSVATDDDDAAALLRRAEDASREARAADQRLFLEGDRRPSMLGDV